MLGAAADIVECAVADLGWAIAQGADGATTVSATVLPRPAWGSTWSPPAALAGCAAGIRAMSRGPVGSARPLPSPCASSLRLDVHDESLIELGRRA